MRLSEAMILGSTIVKLQAGCWTTCAIGAAAKAVGIKADRIGHVEGILDEWPWLEANNEAALCEIATLFDQRVCRGEMTFDELCAYVRQIEPPCECGVRSCCCERVEELLCSVVSPHSLAEDEVRLSNALGVHS
jgi:hypothetical protein